jgi:hypothetical protein
MYQTPSPELCRQFADDRRKQLERDARVKPSSRTRSSWAASLPSLSAKWPRYVVTTTPLLRRS